MAKIVTIVGARPQFIKLSPVSRVLRESFQEVLIHTGQHYDYNLSRVFFDELNIPRPDYNLEIGSHSQGKQTALMLQGIEEVLIKERPDGVLIYGDTNSTLSGAIAASKLHIPVVHIEAGLRSYNKRMPEEINRVMSDHISDWLFAPTEVAVHNLAKENLTENVYLSGDVMFDAVRIHTNIAEANFDESKFKEIPAEFYLCTIHRAENTDDPERLKAIVNSLIRLERPIVLPLHPRTRGKLGELGLLEDIQRANYIFTIEPVSYLEMLILERRAKGIITDSGGVQKEAYFAKKPCFTLRSETEWVETVDSGWNTLVDPVQTDLKTVIEQYSLPARYDSLYGEGYASEKIVETLQTYF